MAGPGSGSGRARGRRAWGLAAGALAALALVAGARAQVMTPVGPKIEGVQDYGAISGNLTPPAPPPPLPRAISLGMAAPGGVGTAI